MRQQCAELGVSSRYLCGTLVICLLTVDPAVANWANWRGPHGRGVADARHYPVTWSASQNLVWKVALPGRGGSTPALWNDAIFVTCEDGEQNAVLRISRQGQTAWKTHMGQLRPGKHRKGTGCNPSPTTDGEHIYVYFKSGDLACLDLQGSVVWQHNLQRMYGPDTLWWDLGTSPVLAGDLVIVACMQSGLSYVAAFNRHDGSLVWKQDRTLNAPEEANQSYTTPALGTQNNRAVVIVLGADAVTCHALDDGQLIWRVVGLNPRQSRIFRSIASPVVASDVVLVPYARGATLMAIRMGGRGDVTDSHVIWRRDDLASDVPTAAVNDGLAFVCSDRGLVQCLQVATGKTLWEQKLASPRTAFSSSPILTGNRLYVTNEKCTTFVLDTAAEGALLATNELDERTVSTPVLVDGRIYQQTFEHLYCIGSDRDN